VYEFESKSCVGGVQSHASPLEILSLKAASWEVAAFNATMAQPGFAFSSFCKTTLVLLREFATISTIEDHL